MVYGAALCPSADAKNQMARRINAIDSPARFMDAAIRIELLRRVAGRRALLIRAFSFPCGPALPARPTLRRRSIGAMRRHLTLRFSADDFPRLLTISYSTCWPSLSVLRPALSTADM